MNDTQDDIDLQKNFSKFNEMTITQLYTFEKTLGKGTFGKVKLAKNNLTNDFVAIKILEKSRIKQADDARHVKTEIQILKQIKHPHIISLLQVKTIK